MKYDVFISYSRKDTSIAYKICEAFDNAGISYFIDKQDIGGAYEFPEILANAILDSRLFLYLASQNSYKSKFTNSEVTFAFNEKDKNCVLPYIIDGSELPVSQRLIFSAINWRNIKEHPINSVLVSDILTLLNRNDEIYKPKSTDNKNCIKEPRYGIYVQDAGPSKLQLIKYVKEVAKIGLKEAKDLVDSVPSNIFISHDYHKANRLANEMRKIGATVTIVDNKIKNENSQNCAKEPRYSIYVQDAGPSKLQLIKYVKEVAKIGLKEAKDLVDSIPNNIFISRDYPQANRLANEMRKIGATVTIIDNRIKNENSQNRVKEPRYSIYVQDAGSAKLALVKYVKEVTKIGLKEAKDLVDSIPNTIFVDCDYSMANKIARDLHEIGATVTITIKNA